MIEPFLNPVGCSDLTQGKQTAQRKALGGKKKRVTNLEADLATLVQLTQLISR